MTHLSLYVPSGGGGGTRGRVSTGCPLAPVGGAIGLPGAQSALMSDHLARGAGGGRSGVAWPASTIPARVKKLSWDDAQDHSHKVMVMVFLCAHFLF